MFDKHLNSHAKVVDHRNEILFFVSVEFIGINLLLRPTRACGANFWIRITKNVCDQSFSCVSCGYSEIEIPSEGHMRQLSFPSSYELFFCGERDPVEI
eukprot:Gb_05428 [translate_table: standard]